MMGSKVATAFLHGFARATLGLGVLLGGLWLVLWGLAAAGGPDWRMPLTLLENAGSLVLIGFILQLLLQALSRKVVV